VEQHTRSCSSFRNLVHPISSRQFKPLWLMVSSDFHGSFIVSSLILDVQKSAAMLLTPYKETFDENCIHCFPFCCYHTPSNMEARIETSLARHDCAFWMTGFYARFVGFSPVAKTYCWMLCRMLCIWVTLITVQSTHYTGVLHHWHNIPSGRIPGRACMGLGCQTRLCKTQAVTYLAQQLRNGGRKE